MLGAKVASKRREGGQGVRRSVQYWDLWSVGSHSRGWEEEAVLGGAEKEGDWEGGQVVGEGKGAIWTS